MMMRKRGIILQKNGLGGRPSLSFARRPDEQRDADHDHRQRQPLPHADHFREAEDAVVGRAEILGDKAQTAVADQKSAGNGAARPRAAGA